MIDESQKQMQQMQQIQQQNQQMAAQKTGIGANLNILG
jgi:chaperonin cofactor prefoldin